MIKLKINESVSVNIDEPNALLELMTGDDLVKLIESLSCHDAVIEHVVSQISSLYGCTENGNSGWSGGVLSSCLIDKVRLEISKGSSEMADKTISHLLDSNASLEKRNNSLHGEIQKLTRGNF